MKKQDKARKALSRKLDRRFTLLEQERMEWGGDTETEHSYSWHFTLDRQRFELAYGYQSKTVTECTKRKRGPAFLPEGRERPSLSKRTGGT